MKRLLAFLLCCVVLFAQTALSAAAKEEKTEQSVKTEEILQRSSTKSMKELITAAYPQDELVGDVAFGGAENFRTMLDWLDEQYPMECIRTLENSSLTYCVYRLREGGYFYIFFYGDSLKFTHCAFVAKESLVKSDFIGIRPGNTLLDVERVDSGAELYNLLHWNICGQAPYLQTFHLVKEGFIRISYRNENRGADGTRNIERHDPANLIVNSIKFIPNGEVLEGRNSYFDMEHGDLYPCALLPQDYPSDLPRPERGLNDYLAAYWWIVPIVSLLVVAAVTGGIILRAVRKGQSDR